MYQVLVIVKGSSVYGDIRTISTETLKFHSLSEAETACERLDGRARTEGNIFLTYIKLY